MEFRERYGPWAIVAGASEGTGRSFARGLAARGVNVLMLANGGPLADEAAAVARFPGAKVCCIESGASWLAGLAERMDEVYDTHRHFVRPKLSLVPSEIIARQVACSFQYDRACVMSRVVTGTKAIMWGADYPHHEGTFPRSKEVIAHLFDDIEISESDKADIVGLNAGRLFHLPHPAVLAAA